MPIPSLIFSWLQRLKRKTAFLLSSVFILVPTYFGPLFSHMIYSSFYVCFFFFSHSWLCPLPPIFLNSSETPLGHRNLKSYDSRSSVSSNSSQRAIYSKATSLFTMLIFSLQPQDFSFLSIMRDYWYLLHLLSRQYIFFLHSYLFFIIIEWVNSIFKVHIPLSNISPCYFIYLFFRSPISDGLTITFFTVVKYQGHFLPRLPCFDIWHLTLSSCWSNWNPE